MSKIKMFFKQLFCKHECEWCRKLEKFSCISGERQYYICKKCGKITDSRFIEY